MMFSKIFDTIFAVKILSKLIFTRKMIEKILKDLKKVKISDILSVDKSINLVDSKSIVDVKVKEKSLTLIVNLTPLNINKDQANIIKELIEKKLTGPFSYIKNVNIIFTYNQENKQKNNAQPQTTQKQQNNKEHPAKRKIPFVKNIIAIGSGKGGVGKSTVSVNLALSLKRIGFKVALVDADIYGPSIAHMMNLQDKPKINENKLMIPLESYGIKCMSIASIVDKEQALVWRGPMITKTLNQLIYGVCWGKEDEEIDYMIIDLPPGTGDVHLSMAQMIPLTGAVIISTPQDIAVIDAIKAIDMFKKLDVPILGLVQNMAYLQDQNNKEKTYLFGKDKAKELAQKQNIKFLGDIKIDISIRQAADNQNPIVNSSPSSDIAFNYGRIAEEMLPTSRHF